MGSDWNLNDANNNMTAVGDGTFTLTLSNLELAVKANGYKWKIVGDHSWSTQFPASGDYILSITEAGTYDVTFTLNPDADPAGTVVAEKQGGPGPEPVLDTLYLVNSKGWGTPKIYFYGGTVGQITAWPGDNMTMVDGVKADGFDVYMFSITHGNQANVIFNNGSGVQSGDLVIEGNEGKYFNFADQTWYESADAVVCTWYLNANYNGTTEWRELTPAADRKSFTRRDVYAPAANYYYNGMAANNLQTEVKGAKLNVASNLAAGDWALYTLDPYAKTINVTKVNATVTKDTAMYVAGNFTNWAEGMQVLPYSVTLPADSALEFKQVRVIAATTTFDEGAPIVVRDTTWYGQMTEGYAMTRENVGEGWVLDGEANVLLNTDAEGEYTFSLAENGAFVVTFPAVGPTGINNIEAGKAVKMIENGQVVIIREGVRYNAVGAKL